MPKFTNSYKEQDEKWNMAVNFLNRLDKRCDERDTHATTGNLLAWFRSLRAIFRNVHFEIKKDGQEKQEEELDELFKKANIALQNMTINQRELTAHSVTETENLLDEIDMRLNDLMYDYGLITYRSKKRNIEQEIEEGWI